MVEELSMSYLPRNFSFLAFHATNHSYIGRQTKGNLRVVVAFFPVLSRIAWGDPVVKWVWWIGASEFTLGFWSLDLSTGKGHWRRHRRGEKQLGNCQPGWKEESSKSLAWNPATSSISLIFPKTHETLSAYSQKKASSLGRFLQYRQKSINLLAQGIHGQLVA